MIGCTKLLCGTATVSEAMRHHGTSGEIPAHMLQFSAVNRPLVVWNTTNRCNLRCQHCYIHAEDTCYQGELTNAEARAMIEDLGRMKAPVLLFSGGEPLMREDLMELGRYAADLGLRPVLSTNGTLINDDNAKELKDAGFQYIGISIDGAPATHDFFRAKEGAFDASIKGLHAARRAGLKTGVRFTLNKHNEKDLPEIFEILEREEIPRFCMDHLVYAGRGEAMLKQDVAPDRMRDIMQYVADKTIELHKKGVEIEILTTDNHADGIWLYNYIKEREPERADEVLKLLGMHGGCSAGTKFGNVDPQGNVHPCQFWQDYTIGNVRETPFSELWNGDDPLLVQLREKEKHVEGKCASCKFNNLCGGCRIRARAVTGNLWAEDPACYLTEEERGEEKVAMAG